MKVYDKSNADALKKNRENYQDWLKDNSGNHFQQATSAIVPITADSAHRRANNAESGANNSVRNPQNSFLVTGPAVTSTTGLDTQKPKGSGDGSYTVNAGNKPYVDQLNSLYDQIVNRKPFQYDLNGDLLYRNIADRYTLLGQQAMRDTMGQAASLTGGYGNSYATQVGNQANQQYLTALNDNIPQLWDRAYQAYMNEGDQLMQKYELTAAHPGALDAIKPRTVKVNNTPDSYQTALYNAGLIGTPQAATLENPFVNHYYELLAEEQKKK